MSSGLIVIALCAALLFAPGSATGAIITGKVQGLGPGSGDVSFRMVDNIDSFTLTLLGAAVDLPAPDKHATGLLVVGSDWLVELVIHLSDRVPQIGVPVTQAEGVFVSGQITHFAQPHPPRDKGSGTAFTIDDVVRPFGPAAFTPNFRQMTLAHGDDFDRLTQTGTSSVDRRLGAQHIGSWSITIQGRHTAVPEPGTLPLLLTALAVAYSRRGRPSVGSRDSQ